MNRPRTMDVDRYDPLLLEVWRRAPVTLKWTSKQTAVSFRHKMYSLRVALKQSDVPMHQRLYEQTKHFKISIAPLQDPSTKKYTYIMSIVNTTDEYKQALESAGITLPEAPALELENDSGRSMLHSPAAVPPAPELDIASEIDKLAGVDSDGEKK